MSAEEVSLEMSVPSSDSPRLGYLLSRYPAISHTFFLYEVLGLRKLGLFIETASINSPDRPLEQLPELEAREVASTYYVKSGSKPALLLRTLRLVASQPAGFCRGLKAVARVQGLTWRKRLLWMAYLAEALLVGDWMRRKQLQHLHVHFGGAVASVGYLTSIVWKIPYSMTIHGPEELQDFQAYQMKEKLAQASFVLCISWFARSQLMQRLPPSSWSKLHVARLGVTEEFLSRPTVVARETDKPHVVCVGRLVPEKGQRLLLQAVERLRAEGVSLALTLVGAGTEQQALERFVQEHELEQLVTFAGARSHPETIELLRSADIFVLPSFAEGIPVALMEAMALEIPCISTTVAGISELIRNGQDGFLVAPSDLEGLVQALKSLAADSSLRARMGASARLQVLELYRLSRNHEGLAQIFCRETAPVVVKA